LDALTSITVIRNRIYREALERVVPEVAIDDGRVLVTGASGLIGSCIIDLLMLANDYGRQFDVYALGRSKGKLSARFKEYRELGCFHIIEQDIMHPLDNDVSYDYIIHGASNADPRNYALYPAETMLTNLEGARNILDYCKAHLETRVLLMSTFEVYGNAGKDVYAETDCGIVNINKIRSCYPESKRCMEILARCYVEEYGVQAVIGRLGSIYGPTMAEDDSKAHAQFLRNGLNGENIVLLAKGEIGEAYNIANEHAVVSIADVAHTVASIARTEVVYDLPDDVEKKGFPAPQNCILNNDRLKALGWAGKYDLDTGIKETLDILKWTIM